MIQQWAPRGEEDPTGEMICERAHVNPPQQCWCRPDLVFEPGNGVEDDFLGVWVHHGGGEELPTGWELAEVISDAIAGRADG